VYYRTKPVIMTLVRFTERYKHLFQVSESLRVDRLIFESEPFNLWTQIGIGLFGVLCYKTSYNVVILSYHKIQTFFQLSEILRIGRLFFESSPFNLCPKLQIANLPILEITQEVFDIFNVDSHNQKTSFLQIASFSRAKGNFLSHLSENSICNLL
jgi:hypothetical protein